MIWVEWQVWFWQWTVATSLQRRPTWHSLHDRDLPCFDQYRLAKTIKIEEKQEKIGHAKHGCVRRRLNRTNESKCRMSKNIPLRMVIFSVALVFYDRPPLVHRTNPIHTEKIRGLGWRVDLATKMTERTKRLWQCSAPAQDQKWRWHPDTEPPLCTEFSLLVLSTCQLTRWLVLLKIGSARSVRFFLETFKIP